MDPKKIVDYFQRRDDLKADLEGLERSVREAKLELETETSTLQATRTERIKEQEELKQIREALPTALQKLSEVNQKIKEKQSTLDLADALMKLIQEPADLTIQHFTVLRVELEKVLAQKITMQPLGFQPDFNGLRQTAMGLLEAVLGTQLVTRAKYNEDIENLRSVCIRECEKALKELNDKNAQLTLENDTLRKDNLRLMDMIEGQIRSHEQSATRD